MPTTANYCTLLVRCMQRAVGTVWLPPQVAGVGVVQCGGMVHMPQHPVPVVGDDGI